MHILYAKFYYFTCFLSMQIYCMHVLYSMNSFSLSFCVCKNSFISPWIKNYTTIRGIQDLSWHTPCTSLHGAALHTLLPGHCSQPSPGYFPGAVRNPGLTFGQRWGRKMVATTLLDNHIHKHAHKDAYVLYIANLLATEDTKRSGHIFLCKISPSVHQLLIINTVDVPKWQSLNRKTSPSLAQS